MELAKGCLMPRIHTVEGQTDKLSSDLQSRPHTHQDHTKETE